MSISILRTKLYVPSSRPNLVHRPRLIGMLSEGFEPGQHFGRRLILISAPAGFGKTSLVSEWIENFDDPVAWLSLDEGDNDPIRFMVYVISALQTIDPKIGESILFGLNSNQPPNETLLTVLLNEIAVNPKRFVLVLDDYHLIDSTPVDTVLTFLLDHIPPNLSLVITTREDPSLPLARYRARGQLSEIRAANLRFTPQEAEAFLNQVMNLNLSEENITALEVRTEGWVTGLQLAALSMQGRHDISSFVEAFTGSHRFVLDYLVEEVLKHQSEHIRDFLLQTAILDSFTASLCNAVTVREDGKEILDILDHNNLFLNPLDDKRQWYRYHHLFAEVLNAHLLESQPNQVDNLHKRASLWYEGNGLRSEAIHHSLLAQDFIRSAELIELAWPAAEAGIIQSVTWLGWVKTLPEKYIHNRPVLNVCYAYALLGHGDLGAAEARLNDTEEWLDRAGINKPCSEISSEKLIVADNEQFNSLPATIAIGHAYIAQAFGNIQDTLKYANQVLELVPEDDSFRHQQASMMMGMTYWASGDLEAAYRVFADYTHKMQKSGNIPAAIDTSVVLADIRLILGGLQEATDTVEKLKNFILEQGEPVVPETADLHRELCELYIEQGNFEAAVQHLQVSKKLGEKVVLPVWMYRWCIAQARLNETMGDLDGALKHLDDAERLFIRTPLPDVQSISALKARIWIKQGKFATAADWADKLSLSLDNEVSFLREFAHITLVRILINKYQVDHLDASLHEILFFIDRLLKAAEEGGRIRSVIEILMLKALAYQAKGNNTLALPPFERALTLAEQEGFISIIVDAGPPVKDLLTSIEPKEITQRLKKFIHKLRPFFDIVKVIASASINSEVKRNQKTIPQSLVEPLSGREIDVLRLLRTDLNGPEIARECMVSLTTIRTHTQNIYSKLGVRNRRAAVRRAEELDLL